jgi:hypothetical protein
MERLTPTQRQDALRTAEAQAFAEFIDRVYLINGGGLKTPGFVAAISLWKELCKHWTEVRRTQGL